MGADHRPNTSQHLGDAVLVVARGDVVGGLAHGRVGVGHGVRRAGPGQHRQVVGHVAERDHVLRLHARSAASSASVEALVTSGPLISSSVEVDDQVIVIRCADRRLRGVPVLLRAELLVAGQQLEQRPAQQLVDGRPPGAVRHRVPLHELRLQPDAVEGLHGVRRAGHRLAQQPADLAGACPAGPAARGGPATRATSQTSAPLETTARPWLPTCSKTSSAQRSGRPVTKTTGTPRSSRAVSTSRVYVATPSRRSGPACRRGRSRPAWAGRRAQNQRPISVAAPSSADDVGDVVGRVDDLLDRLAHGDPAAGPLEHLDVVAAVADREGVGRGRGRAARRRTASPLALVTPTGARSSHAVQPTT